MSGDFNKLLRSSIQVQRIFDSSYFKKLNRRQQEYYQMAVDSVLKDAKVQTWPSYILDRMKWHRLKGPDYDYNLAGGILPKISSRLRTRERVDLLSAKEIERLRKGTSIKELLELTKKELKRELK